MVKEITRQVEMLNQRDYGWFMEHFNFFRILSIMTLFAVPILWFFNLVILGYVDYSLYYSFGAFVFIAGVLWVNPFPSYADEKRYTGSAF